MIKHIYLFILIGLVCISCHQKQEKVTITKKTVNKEYIHGESILLNEVIHPARMAIGNNQLYISCFSCDTMVYTYSLPDLNLLNSHGIKGKGPEDFMFPVFTQAHDNLVSMWGYADLRRIQQYQVDTSGVFTKVAEFKLPENKAYNQLFTLGDSLAFYNDFPPSLTLKKMDLKQGGKEIKEHQFKMAQDEGKSFFAKNKGDLCLSSKGLAYLYYYQNRVDFFDLDFNFIKSVSKPSGETVIDSQNWQNSLVYYIASYAGEKYLYAIKLVNQLNAKHKDCTLDIFDWNGTLITSYSIKSVIDVFVVDEQNKILYGMNKEWPDYIYKIQL